MIVLGSKELVDRLRCSRPGVEVLYASGYTAEAITNHGTLEPDTFVALAQEVRVVLDFEPDRRDLMAGLNQEGM